MIIRSFYFLVLIWNLSHSNYLKCTIALITNWEQIMSTVANPSLKQKQCERDKRIRLLYQSLLQKRQWSYWSILDFPYLAEIVRHDSTYLRRILSNTFIDHPVLSQYLNIIAWRAISKGESKNYNSRHVIYKNEILPIGFERTLWLMYKRQSEVSDIWGISSTGGIGDSSSNTDTPKLNFSQFLSKISGSPES